MVTFAAFLELATQLVIFILFWHYSYFLILHTVGHEAKNTLLNCPIVGSAII